MNVLEKLVFLLLIAFAIGASVVLTIENRNIQEVRAAVAQKDDEQRAGSFSPTGGTTYRLYSSIGSSDSSFTLSSFKEPVSNIPYTMSYLGSTLEYGTLSPQSSVSEFVSFTGITQNSDGTATLTGVTRGMARTPGTGGCVASTTLAQPHSGQSIFILSNPPCFYNEYYTLRNVATSSNYLVFSSTTPPHYDGYGPNFGNFSSTTLVDESRLDVVATQATTNFWSLSVNDITNTNTGTVNINNTGTGTSTFKGPIKFLGAAGGTQPYLLAATSNPPYGYLTGDLIDAGYNGNNYSAINTFNSAPGACASSNFVMNGDIANVNSDYTDIGFTNTKWTGVGATCLSALTFVKPESTYIYNPTGEMDFVLGTTTTSYGFNWYWNGAIKMALDGLGRLTLAGLQYTFPAAQTASSTLQNNGSGILSWLPTTRLQYSDTTGVAISSNNSTTTLVSTTIPANTLQTGNSVEFDIPISVLSINSSASFYIEAAYGFSTSTSVVTCGGSCASATAGYLRVYLTGSGTTGTQNISTQLMTMGTGAVAAATGVDTVALANTKAISVDSTASKLATITIRFTVSAANAALTTTQGLATIRAK